MLPKSRSDRDCSGPVSAFSAYFGRAVEPTMDGEGEGCDREAKHDAAHIVANGIPCHIQSLLAPSNADHPVRHGVVGWFFRSFDRSFVRASLIKLRRERVTAEGTCGVSPRRREAMASRLLCCQFIFIRAGRRDKFHFFQTCPLYRSACDLE